MHTIKLYKKSQTFRVVHQNNRIGLKVQFPQITLHQVGRRGLIGPVGPQGPQGPQGIPGVGDKNYNYPFTNQSALTLIHNLGKYPAVSVMDSAGDEVEAGVEYVDINTVDLDFIGSFSGIVTLN